MGGWRTLWNKWVTNASPRLLVVERFYSRGGKSHLVEVLQSSLQLVLVSTDLSQLRVDAAPQLVEKAGIRGI